MSSAGFKVLFSDKGAARSASFRFFLFAISLFSVSLPLSAQTELGVKDDLTVLGTNGTALDPNTEIKGFTVFGSTQAEYAGAAVGPGNVVINGALAVSSGSYFVGNSTFPSISNIFTIDGTPGYYVRKNSGGFLEWADPSTLGDNLGNHVATTTLNMASWNVVNVSSVNFLSNVFVSSATAVQGGGVYVSTNMYVVGYSSAAGYYGDGSTLANVSTHTYHIGDLAGGGVVYWVDPTGTRVLISATSDQSSGIVWGNNTDFIGAGLDGIYAGRADTVMISTMQGPGSYAARLCQDYAVLGADGVYYDDWYLPSKAELQLLYAQKTVVGGFTSSTYWSSTEDESSPANAWFVYFISSYENVNHKFTSDAVRCVRGGPFSAFDYSRDAETVRNGAYVTSTQTFSGANTFVSSVTVPSAGSIYVNDGTAGQILSKSGAGNLQWASTSGLGDNLGDHTATQDLKMNAFNIVNAGFITANGAVTTYSTLTVAGNAFSVGGSTLVVSNGSVGIGQAANGYKLSVQGTSVNVAGGALQLTVPNIAQGLASSISMYSTFQNTADNGPRRTADIIAGFNGGAWGKEYLAFNVGNDGAANDTQAVTREKLRITGSGIGISTGTPYAALDIVSTGTASNIYAQIWRNGSGVAVASMTSQGTLYATLPPGTGADNLGNHTATQNINLNGHWLSGDGGNAGVFVDASGNASFSGQMNLPTGAGSNYIGAGTGDGASYSTYNFALRGWWGMALKSYDDSVHGVYDFRTGNWTTDGIVSFNGTGNNYFAGNVGIGVVNAGARLDAQAAGSTSADMAQIWRKSDGSIVSSMSATGVMMATKFIGDGSALTNISAGSVSGSLNASQVSPGTFQSGDYIFQKQVTATGYRAAQGVPYSADSSTNGYSFGADGDTGMFSPIVGGGAANGILAFYANNSEAMRISAGNVGISTVTPGYLLTNVGNVRPIFGGPQTDQAGLAPAPSAFVWGFDSYSGQAGYAATIYNNRNCIAAGCGTALLVEAAYAYANPTNALMTVNNGSGDVFTVRGNGNVGIGTNSPNASAALDVDSTAKGMLPPRMSTAQRDAIVSPAAGLFIYNTTNTELELYNGTSWVAAGAGLATGAIAAFASASCPAGWTEYAAARGRFLRGIDNGAGIDPDGTRAPGATQGDLIRSHSHTLTTADIYNTAAFVINDNGSDQIVSSDNVPLGTYGTLRPNRYSTALNGGAETRPANVAVIFCQFSGLGGGSAGAGAGLVNGDIWVGNTSNIAAAVAVSGDATLSNAGVLAIANSAISSAKIADGAIMDADVNTAAAVSGTKISPDFGAQNIVTTGKVGVGTTAPDGALTVQGSLEERDSGDVFRMYKNLASYSVSSPNSAGTVKISLPASKVWSNTMLRVVIKGYDFSGSGAWEVIVGGDNNTTGWMNTSAEIRGSAPFSTVRLAHDGTANVILLGTLANNLQYPKIRVDEVLAGHNNYTGWGSGWNISQIASEAAITNSTTPSVASPALVNGSNAIGTWPINITGTSAGATPSGAAGGALTGTYPNPDLATNQSAAVTWSGPQTLSGGANFPGAGIWNASGSVGIGNASPTNGLLEVAGNIYLDNVTTGRRDIRATMGDNDFWSVGGNPTASNAGVLELATGDDGQTPGLAEPIVVRQYGPGSPWGGTLVRTGYLLDANGNTSFPGSVTAASFSGSFSGNAAGINVVDIRDTSPTPDAIVGDKTVSAQFNNLWGGGWRSALTVAGWTDAYSVWQLMGGSDTSSSENWYLRSGVNSTWNAWREVMHSGNIGSQTVANVTSLAGTWWGTNYFGSNKGASSIVGAANSAYGLEAYSTDGGAAGMSFHRGGLYAVNMGLDPDNVFRIGGWSAPANLLQMDMSGNLTMAGTVTAPTFSGALAGNATTATKINSQGDYAAATPGTTRGPAGLNMFQVYNNGYPIPYGNLLHMAGAGGGQLLVGWSGTDGENADNYIRSKRDNDTGAWSPWAKILTDVNYNSYAPTLAGAGASGTWDINISGTSAGAAPTGAAGGVLSGNYPNPGLATNISVAGSVTASTYLFPPPTGDPSPVITARVVPAGQGEANEKTELILFHANDPANGSGPDQITLRAPALSFQTYNDATVADINNSLGYNERLTISPTGAVNIPGSLTVGGTLSGNAATATQIIATVPGTTSIELVHGNMADNDMFRILVGGTATNAGYAEIATADDGTEPIYVRQYTGVFGSLARSATLLDGAGNTSFPGSLTVQGSVYLPSGYGTNNIDAGTGDGATYSTYNFALRGWYGMALKDYSNTVHGVYDFRTGNLTTSGTANFQAVATPVVNINGIQILEKTGNNGSVSCNTYCQDSQWAGWAGSCVVAICTNGTGATCDTICSYYGAWARCLCAKL